jgi:hypothetical protein
MPNVERRVGRAIRTITRRKGIVNALAGQLTSIHAADILDLTPRYFRRFKRAWAR